jgi:hypothetical protein
MMPNKDIEFSLPFGFRDANGVVYRSGIMRPAIAMDEIEATNDPRVKKNPAYVAIVLISRVLIQLGDFRPVPLDVVERLLAADFIFLQDLYLEINTGKGELHSMRELIETECPSCRHRFLIDINFLNLEN